MIPQPLILVALLLAGVQVSAAQPQSMRDSESVYQAILADARCSGRGVAGVRGSVPVIVRELVSPARESWWTPGPGRPTFADRARTFLLSPLVDALGAVRSDEILSESMAKALGAITIAQTDVEAWAENTDYWAAFFRKFPSASAQIRLSPVAFDVAAREALVYCGSSLSPFCCEGSIVHLRQTNGVWTAFTWHRVWICDSGTSLCACVS